MARISVFGLGYVGTVSAACLARDGHHVVGVDVAQHKVDAILQGQSPIEEPGMAELVGQGFANGRLRATLDATQAVQDTELSLICVGTPSRSDGSLDLAYVVRVSEQIGATLVNKEGPHVVCLRSTVLPGSTRAHVLPALERASGKRAGIDFYLAFNPEFLREGSAVHDYDHAPVTVVGTEHPPAELLLREVFEHLPASLVVCALEVAETVKCSANAWHALKVAFGNEIGAVCRSVGVDSHAVMEIFLADRHLNISERYLRPGFAFGGSCLPKDVRALTDYARQNDLNLPVLQAVLPSNSARIDDVLRRILGTGNRSVGLYGLSFKPGTDDLRESPFVTLVEQLVETGIDVRIYDENLHPERLTGTNRAYIDAHIPELVDLLVSGFDALSSFADLVVIGHNTDAAAQWVRSRDPAVAVLDLAGLPGVGELPNVKGISW